MNRSRILEIADDIEANGKSRPTFDMSSFFEFNLWWKKEGDWCNTSGCIAGYVCTLKLPNFDYNSNHENDAAVWLGLTRREAYALFYADDAGIYIGNITAEMAVVCLRRLAETGEVDWTFAIAACKAEEMAC